MTGIDVTTIGNALVDVISRESDDLVRELGMIKGAMNLVDADRSAMIRSRLQSTIETPGGSAANTAVGIASLGGAAHFQGKVCRDRLGNGFARAMEELSVGYTTARSSDDVGTGCCAILVTPDAQRTLNTYLGASVDFCPEDVDGDVIASSRIVYLEGYLFDPPHAQDAFRHAAAEARAAGTQVALTLSDPFCVDRHRAAFAALVDHHVDLLFANEHELCSLYETASLGEAIDRVRSVCATGAVTRGAAGSLLFDGDDVVEVAADPVDDVVDTTGAGDQYAAGVLFGRARGLDLETCGRLGSIAAAEVISHTGAIPARSLAELAAPVLVTR